MNVVTEKLLVDDVETTGMKRSRRWILFSLSLAMLLSSLGTSIANVALPTISQAFNVSFPEVQWIVIAYLLAITTLIVSVGRLGDMIGRRRLFLVGIVLFTVASALCGVAPQLWMLIAARAAQGLGAAVMMALTMALVGETVAKAKTGSAMGLLATMSAIGTALGPTLGGVLIAGLSWRAIFLLNVPAGILTLFLAHRYLPLDPQGPKTVRAEFDHLGTLLLALTLAAYALAMTIGRGRVGFLNVSLLFVAALGVGLFVHTEARAASPLIRLELFRDLMLRGSLAMNALVSTVVMATLVVGPFYLSRALGLDAATVGLVLSAGPLVAALTGVPAGRVTDRFGAPRIIIAGLMGMMTGSLMLSIMPATLGISGYVAPIVVITAGYGLFQTANNTAVMTNINRDQRGVISGMLNLSRNVGLITGASVMGAVFAIASNTIDITTARPEAVGSGMRITFAVAAVLVFVALAIAVGGRTTVGRKTLRGASVICLLAWTYFTPGQAVAKSAVINPASAKCKGSSMPGATMPTPADPYPLDAAGWGPKAGKAFFVSRWAEDWTGMHAAGNRRPLKAVPLFGEGSLTLSAEARLRYEIYDNAPPKGDADLQQGLFRGVIGADMRLNPNLRVYGEVGTGQAAEGRSEATANFQNDASLQQLFVDTRGSIGSTLVGAMVGRQEFADGPRQLISLSDGPNMHRTWNGVRLYAHGEKLRAGAFHLRATRLGGGLFDEEIDNAERLHGLNASLIVLPEPNIYLDPFWIHSKNRKFGSGDRAGIESRDTYGVRLWGRRGAFRFDWTLARQTGEYIDSDIDAWGVFAVQSLSLSDAGWKPRLTSHIDIASGGGNDGTINGFNQLYTSSAYLGEGRFLSLNNLLLIAPGISVSPTPTINLSAEYGFAQRLTEEDAAYAGGMRLYPGTQNVRGHDIGGLSRVAGTWSGTDNLSLHFGIDHLAAGKVLKRAGLSSGSFGYVALTFRY